VQRAGGKPAGLLGGAASPAGARRGTVPGASRGAVAGACRGADSGSSQGRGGGISPGRCRRWGTGCQRHAAIEGVRRRKRSGGRGRGLQSCVDLVLVGSGFAPKSPLIGPPVVD
jgi:hypothetical protein